jgi:hypothetical protein
MGSLIRSSPEIFKGIMRIRTHFFLIAMREEISRVMKCNEEEAIENLFNVSLILNLVKSLCNEDFAAASFSCS